MNKIHLAAYRRNYTRRMLTNLPACVFILSCYCIDARFVSWMCKNKKHPGSHLLAPTRDGNQSLFEIKAFTKVTSPLGSTAYACRFESCCPHQTNIIRTKSSQWEMGSDLLFSSANSKTHISETVLLKDLNPNQEAQERKKPIWNRRIYSWKNY